MEEQKPETNNNIDIEKKENENVDKVIHTEVTKDVDTVEPDQRSISSKQNIALAKKFRWLSHNQEQVRIAKLFGIDIPEDYKEYETNDDIQIDDSTIDFEEDESDSESDDDVITTKLTKAQQRELIAKNYLLEQQLKAAQNITIKKEAKKPSIQHIHLKNRLRK